MTRSAAFHRMTVSARRLFAPLLVAVLAMALAACTRPGPLSSGSEVRFTDEGATTKSGYAGPGPAVAAREGGPRWLVTVFQGRQNTGGYSIRVERITTTGTILRVRARFTAPRPGDIVTQVLTSPAHTVGLPFLADLIVLYDQDDVERARWQPGQRSTPSRLPPTPTP